MKNYKFNNIFCLIVLTISLIVIGAFIAMHKWTEVVSKYDVPATPELAYRYFTAIGDTENANRFGPPKDNDGGSDISGAKTLMNPNPSGLPIHDIVN